MKNPKKTSPARPESVGGKLSAPLSVRRLCTRCGRRLPLAEFYRNAVSGRIDSHCKDCRREAGRRRRLRRTLETCTCTAPRPYPVITRLPDREERLRLIRKALQTVAESIRRRREREDACCDAEE